MISIRDPACKITTLSSFDKVLLTKLESAQYRTNLLYSARVQPKPSRRKPSLALVSTQQDHAGDHPPKRAKHHITSVRALGRPWKCTSVAVREEKQFQLFILPHPSNGYRLHGDARIA